MRPLFKRSLSGLIYIMVMVCGLLLHPLCFAILMMCCIGVMTIEFYTLTVGHFNKPGQIMGLLSCLLFFVTLFVSARYSLWNAQLWLVLTPLAVIATGISVLYDKDQGACRHGAFLLLPLLYIAVPFSLCNFIVFDGMGNFSGKLLLSLFIVLWASDVGGYVIGTAFGQKATSKKLFPRISPKKSWIGVVGSVVFSVGVALALKTLGWMAFGWLHCIAISLIISIFGIYGDLVESRLKRYAGVKDSGNIMPGHGGLLDRFDASLLAFPVAIGYILFISYFL